MTHARPRQIGSSIVINLGIISVGLAAIAGILIVQFLETREAVPAEPIELALQLEPVAEGLESPVLLIGNGSGSGDRYVVEQAGRVVRLGADGRPDPEPVLDIVDRVLYHHERGLLGLAFHPDFGDNGRLFVAYSRRADGATSISAFTLPDDQEPDARPVEETEMPLLTIAQPFTTHKGGMLAFDHDGMLLVAVGDGGSADDPLDHGLDRSSLLGTLLRLDVDRGWPYVAPADNGFADDPEARPEIHAIGLRNPWRFSVDRATGDVYIGDVGQREWEEVNVLRRGRRGASFGWSDMEGRGCFGSTPCDPAAHILPAVAYPHVEGDTSHCGVMGGYVYRGDAGSLPDGVYVYADYCSGTIWAVRAEQLLADVAAPAVVGHVPPELGQVQAFGEDDAGELYLLTSGGHVLRIRTSADIA